ncbi:MAG: hypothetical protein HMLKMBBP_03467 [Planctomycetes bacterium]|nr:hypothetical protein [Planctomycetota bacterium]
MAEPGRRSIIAGIAACALAAAVLATRVVFDGTGPDPDAPRRNAPRTGGLPRAEPRRATPPVPRGDADEDLLFNGRCAVRLRVTGAETGDPVANARVSFRDADGAVTTATADAYGVAILDCLDRGEGRVAVSAHRFEHAELDVVAAPDRVVEATVKLERAPAVAVRVIDAVTGAPVVGASVHVASAHRRLDESSRSGNFAGVDETGLVTIPVPRNEPLIIHAEASGFISAMEALRSGGARSVTKIDLRLAPASRIEGRVLGPDGRPLNDAGIDVWVRSASASQWSAGASVDDGNRYRADGLVPGGAYEFSASADGFTDAAPLRLVAPPARTALRADIRVRAPTRIVVHAVDEDGTTFSPDDLSIHIKSGRLFDVSSHNGEFTVAPGRWNVAVRVKGRTAAAAVRDVAPGERWELMLTVPRGVTLAGAVTSSSGVPVHGASVYVESEDAPPAGPFPTDASGRFEAAGLRPGPKRIEVHSGAEFLPAVLESAPCPGPELRVTLRRAGRVSVQVARTDGLPIGSLEFKGVCDEGLPRSWKWAADSGGRVVAPWPSDISRWLVCVRGCAPAVLDVSVPPETTLDLPPLVLEPERPIRGRIRTRDGHAPHGILIEATMPSDPELFDAVEADADGCFRFGGLRAGTVVLEARPDSGPKAVWEVMTGGVAPIDLVYPETGVVIVRVTASDGAPVSGASVTGIHAAWRSVTVCAREEDTTDSLGAALLRMPAGPATLWVDGFESADVDVPENDTVTVRFTHD